jgi:signal transduction histidine kinase
VLTAGIAHEINNPINFISSGITGLEMVITDILAVMKEYTAHCEDITNCKRKNIVQEIEKKHDLSKSIENITTLLQSIQVGVDRTTNIVKSLRTFSRLDNESRSLTNVHELIDSSIAILGNKLKDRIVVVKEYKLTQPIECFPGKLSQVFLNLVMNAIQAIEKTGTITIISRKIVDMDKIEILIRDTGKGMSEEVQKRIFDPFYTTKPVGEGTGMGLSIVHGIIKDHNGEIVVTSKVGEGTEFKIVLPIT